LDHANVGPVAALPYLEELNIGHGLLARAVILGLERAVIELRAAIRDAVQPTGARRPAGLS
jgi:pyridoxine 5-phosphate synthase